MRQYKPYHCQLSGDGCVSIIAGAGLVNSGIRYLLLKPETVPSGVRHDTHWVLSCSAIDHRHLCSWNFNFTISVDVVR